MPLRCSPGEWAELLPLVEYIRFLTPNASGITPRDLDKCWEVGTSVERDLALMAAQSPLEPLAEVAQKQLSAFRRVRNSMLQAKARDANRRVEITNRHRSARKPAAGDCVMLRDPKFSKKRAGHSAGQRPLEGPYRIVEVYGGESGTKARSEHLGGGLHVQEARADTFVYLKPERFRSSSLSRALSPPARADLRGGASGSSLSSTPGSGVSPLGHRIQKRIRRWFAHAFVGYTKEPSSRSTRYPQMLPLGAGG